MGKKPKNVKPKLFDKTNNCNFTLVFIKPTVEERAIQVERKKYTELIEQTRLELTTKNFNAILEKKDDASDDDDLLFDSEDELYDEEEEIAENEEVDQIEDLSGPREIYLDDLKWVRQRDKEEYKPPIIKSPEKVSNPRVNLAAMAVTKTEGDTALEINYEEPINLDSLLAILANKSNFKKYEKDKVFFKNDYMLKFNVNIELFSFLSFENFSQVLDQLSKLLSHPKCKKYIIDIPFDVVSRLKKCLVEEKRTDKPKLNNYHRAFLGHLSIGSLVNMSKFFVHFEVPRNLAATKDLPILLEIKYLQRCMAIYFYLDTSRIMHKLFFNFSSFRTIVVERHETFDRIYFECIQTPMLHYAELSDQDCETLLETDQCDISPIYKRTIQFKFIPKRSFHQDFAASHKPTDVSLLGMSKTFCIDVLETDKDPFLNQLIHIAYICRERNKSFQFYFSTVQHFESRNNYADLKTLIASCNYPFSIYYACLVLFSTSYKILDALEDEKSLSSFLGDVKQDVVQSPDIEQLACLEQCIYHLKVQIKESVVINVYEEFSKLLSFKADNKPVELHEDYVLIRRATLYPSHLELVQPVSLLKSRFTNLANLEYGIRMTILDDNGRVLNKCKDPNEFDFIMGILKPQLLDGVKIGDRIYEFLGSSTSQMRDNGCTLYAQDQNGRNAEDIRNAAGELRVFNRNVSKYIARFGLVFSQAMTIIELDPTVTIKYARDILGEVKPNCRNYKNFKKERHILSDGIGIVSKSVAELFQPYLQIKADYFPSAYQIRFGGVKGMLTVWDIPQKTIIFRNSMKKYDSDSRLLGILKYSMPRWVFLNRPLINILDHLKVCRDEFYHYFYQSTASVAKATLYDSCAMDLIRIYATGLLPYEDILNASISLLDEPFLRSIINYLIHYRLNFELKWKARIRVPNESGRIAFGVLDESQTLEYGEIYFQYTKMNEEGGLLPETAILEGEVMVTKFPCLQPGDVRKFKAVKVDKLSHIKDCLVFPAKGKRGHPDEMGGSDLDGDEYAIFWNTLKFPGPNEEPMDFPYGLSRGQQYDITIEDIVNFFCSYLVMNNIGMVANMHLMLSDYLIGGLNTRECEDLAFTYQISLDFPKTGVIEAAPRKYFMSIRPDFMERNKYDKTYLSKRMLGEFYRHCSIVEKSIELSQYDYRFSMFDPSKKKKKKELNTKHFKNPKSLIKNKLILNGWKKFHDQAEEAFLEYKLKVVDIMEQLEVENEVMLFADVYEDKKDVTKALLKNFFIHFENKFKKQCEQLDCVKTVDRLYLASAWYAICYEKCFSYNGKPLLGLPWIIAKEIIELAQFSFSGKVANEATLKANLRTHVDKHGEKWTVSIGANHKELALYRPENELFQDILFDYKMNLVYNTNVVQFYWCPFAVVQAFKKYHPHLLALHHELIDEIQLKIVLGLVMKWINTIKRRVYKDNVTDRVILLFKDEQVKLGKEQNQQDCFTINEDKLLQEIVTKRLKQIHQSCGRKPNRIGESLPTISTLFNQFLFYLFEIVNRANQIIYQSRMEELFLLKYAIFALSFINKLDTKLDRSFYVTFSMEMQSGNWGTHIFMLEQIYTRRMAKNPKDEDMQFAETFPPAAFDAFNVYYKSLDSLFDTYLADNSSLVYENIFFNLLPSSQRVDLRDVDRYLLHKLYYLSGVKHIEFSLSNEDTQHLEEEKQEQNDGADSSNEQQSQPANGTTSDKTDNGSVSEKGGENKQPQSSKPIPRLEVSNIGPMYNSRPVVGGSRNANRPPMRNNQSQVDGKPRDQKVDIEKLMKIGHYLVKTSGLEHSTLILRLLIGHPLFFENICYRFDIKKTETVATNDSANDPNQGDLINENVTQQDTASNAAE